MQAIVPAAGIGTRLRPHTYTNPKALLPVAGKPILDHILDRLADSGVDRLILVTGYLGDRVAEHVSKEYDFDLSVAVQESMDGLADAVHRAAPHVADEPVLVVLGDTLFSADLISAIRSPCNMIAVHRVDDPSRFGVVVMEEGKVARLVEKPREHISDLAIVGVYYFVSASRLIEATSELIESGRRTRGEFQLTDAMQLMLQQGDEFSTFDVEDWFDCGKPETLLETNRVLLDRLDHDPPAGHGGGNSFTMPVFVAPDASLEGCRIGPHVSIGPGSRLVRSTVRDSILAGDCEIVDSRLHGSLLGRGTRVHGFSGVVDIGDSCSVAGAGAE